MNNWDMQSTCTLAWGRKYCLTNRFGGDRTKRRHRQVQPGDHEHYGVTTEMSGATAEEDIFSRQVLQSWREASGRTVSRANLTRDLLGKKARRRRPLLRQGAARSEQEAGMPGFWGCGGVGGFRGVARVGTGGISSSDSHKWARLCAYRWGVTQRQKWVRAASPKTTPARWQPTKLGTWSNCTASGSSLA